MTRLSALRLEIPSDPDRVYHDDGYVASIADHVRKLDAQYKLHGSAEFNFRSHVGLCIGYRMSPDQPKHIHVFYKRKGHTPTDTYIRGHEETHALKRLGRSSALGAYIRELGADPWILKCPNEEIVASIGGIIACFLGGFSLEDLPTWIRRKPEFTFGLALLQSGAVPIPFRQRRRSIRWRNSRFSYSYFTHGPAAGQRVPFRRKSFL